jgi:phage terminase large subunit-like protein
VLHANEGAQEVDRPLHDLRERAYRASARAVRDLSNQCSKAEGASKPKCETLCEPWSVPPREQERTMASLV